MDLGGVIISEASHQVWADDEEIILSPKEYDLLLYLVHNKGLALSRSKILDNVWGYDYYGDERTVDTNIKRLREKLKSKAELISTVRGSGYRFEVKNEKSITFRLFIITSVLLVIFTAGTYFIQTLFLSNFM